MSEVKRYNPELEKDIGLGLPCLSMLGNPYGEWVHYQDYAELKAQRDALASENALIHSAPSFAAMMQALDEFYEHEEQPETGMLAAYKILLPKRLPLTTAYLNSVRAEGVEMWVKQLNGVTGWTVKDAEKFAVQLRAGEPS